MYVGVYSVLKTSHCLYGGQDRNKLCGHGPRWYQDDHNKNNMITT